MTAGAEMAIYNAIGGLVGGLLQECCKPENMKLIGDSFLGTNSVSHGNSPADSAIVALKSYKQGVISKDQALRICAIALEDAGKTVDVEAITALEKLFK